MPTGRTIAIFCVFNPIYLYTFVLYNDMQAINVLLTIINEAIHADRYPSVHSFLSYVLLHQMAVIKSDMKINMASLQEDLSKQLLQRTKTWDSGLPDDEQNSSFDVNVRR